MATPSADPTPITPPRVPFFDERSGLISREWYMFFLSLFRNVDAPDLMLQGPSAQDLSGEFAATLQTAQLAAQLGATQADVAALQSAVQGLALAPPPRAFKRARYGQFLDTTTQVAAAINTAYAITYNTTDTSNGVYIGSPTSRIYVDEPGVYNFVFSVEISKTSGGTGIFWIWPSINGTDVPNSASQVQIQDNNAEIFSATGFFLILKAGDYVEFKFAVNDTSVQLQTYPASAFAPAVPSIIVTVTDNIQGVQ